MQQTTLQQSINAHDRSPVDPNRSPQFQPECLPKHPPRFFLCFGVETLPRLVSSKKTHLLSFPVCVDIRAEPARMTPEKRLQPPRLSDPSWRCRFKTDVF